jgi:hypothetical protein
MLARTVTDTEIGLIKAMLARGMKNRDIQFYFNRQDRPVNSGRITQIRSGNYGPNAIRATDPALDAFLTTFAPREVGALIRGAAAKLPLADRAKAHFERRGSSGWYLKTHETDQAECKQSFGLRPDNRFGPTLRAIAGLANNCGGFLFFGIEELSNKSLKVIGLSSISVRAVRSGRD